MSIVCELETSFLNVTSFTAVVAFCVSKAAFTSHVIVSATRQACLLSGLKVISLSVVRLVLCLAVIRLVLSLSVVRLVVVLSVVVARGS